MTPLPFDGAAAAQLHHGCTTRFDEMRPLIRGLRDRDLQHRIERLALRYLEGRFSLIDGLDPARPAPASLAHHLAASRFHAQAHEEVTRSTLAGLTSATLGDLLSRCHRHLELGRVRMVLVGGPSADVASVVASSLAADHGAVLLGGAEPRTVERLLERGEQVVVEAPFERAVERQLLRDVALATTSDPIELRCALPAPSPGAESDHGADPWPEATLIPADSGIADALDRAATACGWTAP